MRKIVVTGATRGIGRAITELLLNDGCFVYGIYKDSADQAQEIEGLASGQSRMIQADLSNEKGINHICEILQDTEISGIVNNAGVVNLIKWEDFSFKDWGNTLDVNLTAPLRLVHGLRNQLSKDASIVNISSIDAFYAAYDTIPYAVSKAGLINLTKSLSAILGEKGVRVNAIAPGWVDTEMTENSMLDESKELTPLGRNASPLEIAKVVNFLLSENSSFINGETIVVDGGLTAVDYTLYKESQNED